MAISQIVVDQSVQIRRTNREDAIARYEQILDKLPPITLFRVTVQLNLAAEGDQQGSERHADKLLLADGFHRLAAHLRQGREQIAAEIREGTFEDALEYAVLANVAHGKDLTDEEIADGIKRLHQLRPDAQVNHLADLMNSSRQTVVRVLKAQEIRRSVVGWKPIDRFSDRSLSELAPLPQHQWEPALKAVDKLKLNPDGLRAMVQNLTDPQMSDEHKRRLLEGKAKPKLRTIEGELKTPLSLIERSARKAATPADPVGDDVAERLKAVRWEIELRYQQPSDKTRVRALKTYARESETVVRRWTINMGPEALEYDPMRMGQEVGKFILRTLKWEGFPTQNAFSDDRPGSA